MVATCMTALVGCAEGDPGSHYQKASVDKILDRFEVSASVAETSIAHLAYQPPPGECTHAFRIRASYEPGLKFEPTNEGGLAIGRHRRRKPYAKRRGDGTKGATVGLPNGPIPHDVIVPGELFYKGYRAEKVGATRDIFMSTESIGPASPMAGCFWRTWDPMEDALALGWPQLPGRLTKVGEKWAGMRVDAQCSRAACVDPKTGGGGPDNHYRPCVTEPFQETLGGVFEIGGERFALIVSTWDDGHQGEGISSQRETLVSVEHGRPVWAQIVVDHRFAQPTVNERMEPIVRTWDMTAIDECPGSLASVGWKRSQDTTAMVDMLRESLADADELRRGKVKKGKGATPPGE